jgi:competence protein ComEC
MKKNFQVVLGCIVALDVLVWFLILYPTKAQNPELYFLPVGQGDSSLVNFGDVQLLIDGGPVNGKARENLEKILPPNDRYLDLVMISHPQLDHYGGLIEVLKNYEIGAVLIDGQTAENASWRELEKIIQEKKIPKISLYSGDKIKYGDSVFEILNPKRGEWAKDINDLSLVVLGEIYSNVLKNIGIDSRINLKVGQEKAEAVRVLFTGDIGAEKEKELARLYDLDADILKVSHHGSKYSSDATFLKEVSPAVSIIEVGKNRYGHPTKEALSRLASVGSQVYRTDENGIVRIVIERNRIKVYNQK